MYDLISPMASPHCAACTQMTVRGSVRGQTILPQPPGATDIIDIGFQTAAPNGPPGSQIISAFTYDSYWVLENSIVQEEVQTLQYDFVMSQILGQDNWRSVLDNIKAQLLSQGLEISAYILWENVIADVSVPSRVCIPGHPEWCWTPPFAGENVFVVFQYRLWLMIIPFTGPRPMTVSPAVAPFVFVIPVLTILGLVFAFVVVTFTVITAIQIFQGKMTIGQAVAPVKEILKVPGESISAPIATASWPFFALGIALVAAGIFIPLASTQVTAGVPIGGGRVEVTGRAGGR